MHIYANDDIKNHSGGIDGAIKKHTGGEIGSFDELK